MKIVLVIPPSPFLLDDRVFPFLGPLQIGAVARNLGHEVEVADLTGYKQRHPEVVHAEYELVFQEAAAQLKAATKDADLVGFYSLAAQHPTVVGLLKAVKEVNGNCVTVVGGPHANTAPESCRHDGFDYVVVSDQGGGGGEPGFIELLRRLSTQGDGKATPSQKKRLVTLSEASKAAPSDERIIKVSSREGVEWENDKWPLPARDLIDLNSYHYDIGGHRATSIVSATGCPYACSYSFTGDTYVLTSEGPIQIKDLIAGDPEFESCEHGGTIAKYKTDVWVATHKTPHQASFVLDEGVRPIIKLEFENGSVLKVTAEHPIYTKQSKIGKKRKKNAWVKAGDLKIGDIVVAKDIDQYDTRYAANIHSLTKLISIDTSLPPERVYDLTVPGAHSFVANGIVSHNCSHWAGYRKLEARSAKRVQEEIRQIKSGYGIDAIMFYDDEINLRPDFTTEFLPMLQGEDILWRAFFKSGKNLTKESIFEQMKNSGCHQMCTGAESANPQILKDIKKGATVEDNTNFVRYCIKYGIKPKVFTQVGLPGETPDTIKELRNWLVQMAQEGLTDADVSITTPYEGTPMFEQPEKHKIKFDKNELDFSKEVVLYKGTPGEYKSYVWHENLTREDLVHARQWVEDEFRKAAGLKPILAKDDG